MGNLTGHEIFAGIPIHTTRAASDLKDVWREAYQGEKLRMQCQGKLRGYWKQKLGKAQDGAVTSNKYALEAVYLALESLFLNRHPEDPFPPYHLLELIERSELNETDIEWVNDLFRKRVRNKDGEFRTTEAFRILVRKGLDIPELKKTERHNNSIKSEEVKQRLNSFFL